MLSLALCGKPRLASLSIDARAAAAGSNALVRGETPGRTLHLPLAYLRKNRSFLNAFLVNYNWCMDNKMYKRAG